MIRSVYVIYHHHVVASASEVRDPDAEGVDLTRYGLNIAGAELTSKLEVKARCGANRLALSRTATPGCSLNEN
jgi:hypothetical protein